MRCDFAAIGAGEPDIRCLRHQVSNGQDQSGGIDDDAVSDTLRAQDIRGERVLGNDSA